jgi:hypothetical protein
MRSNTVEDVDELLASLNEIEYHPNQEEVIDYGADITITSPPIVVPRLMVDE